MRNELLIEMIVNFCFHFDEISVELRHLLMVHVYIRFVFNCDIWMILFLLLFFVLFAKVVSFWDVHENDIKLQSYGYNDANLSFPLI